MGTLIQNDVVLVAGGTGVLGQAVTRAFLEAGSSVAVTYRRPEEFEVLRGASGPDAARLSGFPIDVTDEGAVVGMFEEINARLTRIDAVVNTVGGYSGGTKLWETDAAVLDRMLALNLRSGFVLSRAAVRAMLPRGRGAIVNVGAKAALHPAAGGAVYAASKAAAVAMMDALAAEVKGTGIRVNTVLPSVIDTPANRAAMPAADHVRWPKPEEIAKVILFLCSEDARVVHGASIPVYGQS